MGIEFLDKLQKIVIKLSFLNYCSEVLGEGGEDVKYGYYLVFDEVLGELINLLEEATKTQSPAA